MATTPTTPTKKTEPTVTLYDLPGATNQLLLTRKTLTKEELGALQAHFNKLKPTQKTNVTKSTLTQAASFKNWAEGLTAFTQDELISLYAGGYNLTPEETNKLKGEITASETRAEKLAQIKKPPVPPQKITRPAPDLLITRTPYPKWWKDLRVSGITIVGSGVQLVATGGANNITYIASITLVVDGPTSISFGFGTVGASGPMAMGDTGQPMGITISMSDSPAPCGQGGFSVHAIGPGTTVGGFIVYYVERIETPT